MLIVLKFRLAMKLKLETISNVAVIFIVKTVNGASIRLHARYSHFPNTLLENILRVMISNPRLFDADTVLTFNLPKTNFSITVNLIDITRMEYPIENVRDRIGFRLVGKNSIGINTTMLDRIARDAYLICIVGIDKRPWNLFKWLWRKIGVV